MALAKDWRWRKGLDLLTAAAAAAAAAALPPPLTALSPALPNLGPGGAGARVQARSRDWSVTITRNEVPMAIVSRVSRNDNRANPIRWSHVPIRAPGIPTPNSSLFIYLLI